MRTDLVVIYAAVSTVLRRSPPRPLVQLSASFAIYVQCILASRSLVRGACPAPWKTMQI